MLKITNPKQLEKFLNKPEGIPFLAKDMIEEYTKQLKKDRAVSIEELIGTAKRMKKMDDDIIIYKKQIIEDMVSKGTDRPTAEAAADTILEMTTKAAGKKPTPKVTEEGLLELENIHKNLITEGRKLNSNGGLQKMLGE